MSLRRQIYRSHAVAALAVAAMAALGLHAVWSSKAHHEAVAQANRQLADVTALKASANRFSEQIAEYLLVGEPERPDFESARTELELAFDRFERSSVGGDPEVELEDLHRLQRMRALYAQIGRVVGEAVALRVEGRQEEAIQIFRRDIEDRLDAEFETLLTSAVLDEAEEMNRAERASMDLWRRLVLLLLGGTALSLASCLGSGFFLARWLKRPLRLLSDGAERIARGLLDHRIAYDGRDELGALARRLNEMAAVQQEQRGLLLGARAELEREVAQRTAELAAANQRLTDLDRLRVRFLAEVGHELRTPLTALRGEAEVTLRHHPKPEDVYRDTLQRIVAYASGMGRVVDDLLFMTRSEADNLHFQMRLTLLQEVIAAAIRDCRTLGRFNGVDIDAHLPEEPIHVNADPARLVQALLILLHHGISFSPPERPVLLLLRSSDSHAAVVVRDYGKAIPSAELPQVFDRFYRGWSGRLTGEEGGLLNLAMAKWLVEKHGGQLTIQSEEGRFTEVTMCLPKVATSAAATSRTAPPQGSSS